MKNLYIIILLFLTSIVQSQIVNIPDANFKNALINENVVDINGDGLLDGDADTNNDGEIQQSEAESIFRLKVDNFNISSLEGVQSFINLKRLECNDNELTSLDMTLNPNLEVLYCSFNSLTSLDITQNTNLIELVCFGNNFADLDVSYNTNLNRLTCFNNQLTSLNITENHSLESLDCSFNSITNLDVSQNPNIEVLYCSGAQLSSLDVSQNPKLEYLSFSDSNLTTLDVSQNPDLRWLFCNDNQLTSLDLSTNTNFERLHCINNQLTSLNIKNGNNYNVDAMLAYGNPELFCIQVDDKSYADMQDCYPDNWCKGVTAVYSEDCTLGIEEFNTTVFKIYPNPTSTFLNIISIQSIERVEIYSVNGSLIKEFFENKIDVSQLQTGLYFVKISSNGKTITKKFLKS